MSTERNGQHWRMHVAMVQQVFWLKSWATKWSFCLLFMKLGFHPQCLPVRSIQTISSDLWLSTAPWPLPSVLTFNSIEQLKWYGKVCTSQSVLTRVLQYWWFWDGWNVCGMNASNLEHGRYLAPLWLTYPELPHALTVVYSRITKNFFISSLAEFGHARCALEVFFNIFN